MAEIIDSRQAKIDAFVSEQRILGDQIRQNLRDATRGRRWDTSLVTPWADERENPNDWAIEEMARRVVADSAVFRRDGWRVDAGETRLFARSLTQQIAAAVPTLYLPNQARAAFPVNTSLAPGAREIAYHRIIDHDDDSLGLLGQQANDIQLVDVDAEEITHRMQEFARGVRWTFTELEEAAFAQIPLQTEKLAALMRRAERVFEVIAFQGLSAAGFTGAYNNAAIPPIATVTGSWATATHDQIMGDIRFLLYSIEAQNGDNYLPNRLAVPSSLWQYLGVRRANTDLTVMAALKQEFPDLQVVRVRRADTYDVAGTGPRLMAYYYDATLLSIAESKRFALEAPERKGFAYEVDGRQKLGGCQVNVPLTAGYQDGN